MAKRFGFINTEIYVAKKSYKIRPEPSCFGITSLISDNNQEDHFENHTIKLLNLAFGHSIH